MPSEDLCLRPAAPGDLAAVAEVLVAAREAAGPAMPPLPHGPDRARAHVLGLDLAESGRELWVADDGRVVGFVGLHDAWLEDLYVLPERVGEGVGSALLDLARALRPDGFCLWVFAANAAARAFYAAQGLVELETTDGSGNAERSPDVRMAWPGAEPLAFLRSLIDEVDDGLGDLLARRVALTRAVQGVKPAPGGSGSARDPGRERAVARRLAARAPELGEERLARVVDLLVAESLAASEAGPSRRP